MLQARTRSSGKISLSHDCGQLVMDPLRVDGSILAPLFRGQNT